MSTRKTEQVNTTRPAQKQRKKHAAAGSRMITGGLAIGSCLLMVGAMAASAQHQSDAAQLTVGQPATEPIQQIVVLATTTEPTAPTGVPPTNTPLANTPRSNTSPTTDSVTGIVVDSVANTEPQVITRVVTIEIPAPTAPAAEPQTTSGGS